MLEEKSIKNVKELNKKVDQLLDQLLDVDMIKSNINYTTNVGLQLDRIVQHHIEYSLLSQIKNDDLREIISSLLSDSDLFCMYDDLMSDQIYNHIIFEIVDHIIQDEIGFYEDIKTYQEEFYKTMESEDVEYGEYSPILEIEIGLNFKDEYDHKDYPTQYDLIYDKPIFINDIRLISNDDCINPTSSIMLHGYL